LGPPGARLLHERNSVENKYREFLRGYAAPGGAVIANYQDFAAYVDKAMRDAQQLMGEVPRVWSRDAQERAFGAPGSVSWSLAWLGAEPSA
jgi:hypothetical protein